MNGLLLTLVGLICAALWLLLLLVTNFSAIWVGAGLLAVLSLSSSPLQHSGRSTH
jgi:hypothetical protein